MLRPSTAPRLILSLSKERRGALRMKRSSMRAMVSSLVLSLSKDEAATRHTGFSRLTLVIAGLDPAIQPKVDHRVTALRAGPVMTRNWSGELRIGRRENGVDEKRRGNP
jgi:hypothetical protein